MDRKVSPNFIQGKRCPECGGAVRKEYPVERLVNRRLCPADIEEKQTVTKHGHEVCVKTVYWHTCDVFCAKCNNLFSQYDLVEGEPNNYPSGYFIAE